MNGDARHKSDYILYLGTEVHCSAPANMHVNKKRVFFHIESHGHIARLEDNRWTKRCTEWQPRRGKRTRGRPSRRWQDDITEKEGTTWIRKATDRRRWKTLMEGYILQWMDKA